MKPKVLIFIDWFSPGFKAGGPIKSVSNIVYSLHKHFNFLIVTSDRDLNENAAYRNLELDTIIEKDLFSIIYLTPENRDRWIKNRLKTVLYDCYYFNSLFSKEFTLKPLSILNKLENRKIIIAPRGMMGKGALQIKSIKKKIFLNTTKITGFFKNVSWHATDSEEIEDIQLAFGKQVIIHAAPNISIIDIKEIPIKKKEKELKLVFLSRISPKKNLKYALEVLKKAKLDNVTLDVYGTIEDIGYWNDCKEFIKKNDLKVHYASILTPDLVNLTLSKYHFLFFPTLHENYGHVIVEALTAGCGLILSTNTPWRDLNQINVGWDINLLEQQEFVKKLEICYNMSQNDYDIIRGNSYKFICNEIEKQNAVELTKKMFNS